MRYLLLITFSVTFFANTVYSQDTIHIPIDYPTIQDGINASFNGDIILVHPGTYNENFNYGGKLITVASLFLTTQDTNFISQTIIEGDTCASVIFESGEDSTAKLMGFTFQNAYILIDTCGVIYCKGSSPAIINNRVINSTVGELSVPLMGGGCITCINASPTIRNNIISNSKILGFGGGIFCKNSSAIISDNIIQYDTVYAGLGDAMGGGIFLENSSPNIFDNYIANNFVCGYHSFGGGIYSSHSSPNIVGNNIMDNHFCGQVAGGGGIFCTDSSFLIVSNNYISNNKGGIACVEASFAMITGNEIIANSEVGIYANSSSLTITDNIISEHDGLFIDDGWGIDCSNSTLTIRKNTITNNGSSLGTYNGGIFCSSGSFLTIDSCIISNNGAFGLYSQPYGNASTISIHNCNISGNSRYGIYNQDSVIINAEYNWWGDPSGPGGAGLGLGDSVSQYVNFEPWLMQPIPVELTSFTATTQAGTVLLNWITVTEVNNLGFEIERNQENAVWERIGFVKGYGTTAKTQTYTFIDKLNGIISTSILYRLKQIDFDGSFEYSDVVCIDNLTPADFILHQNYPNPFNPITKIKYSVPHSSKVTIKVFDILGNEIKTLVNEDKQIGNYEIIWHAEDLPSGVYFYRLQVRDFIETKKMILMN